jgi:serine/threonine protein kinase
LYQLHRNSSAHQDLKPSNALVFGKSTIKIGDLGRAADRVNPGPHESLKVAGDLSYAPPELLYGYVPPDWGQRRFGCDLYLLGSMVVFFFTGTGVTGVLLSQLHPSQHWQTWTGTFIDILPYLRDGFEKAVEQFSVCLPPQLKMELSTIVRQLCDPDPNLRGHPENRNGVSANPHSLERFVSSLNLLARKAELKIIKAN